MIQPTRRWNQAIEWAALAVLLGIAAAFRLVGVTHDLDFVGASFDESNNFVLPAMRMWQEGTPNPGPYAGYPGFFNWLIFLPVGVGMALGDETGAYVAARTVCALFGVLSVFLIHRLGRRLFGAGGGLFAAALLAFSRGEVREAHSVSPDVLLVSAALGLFLWLHPADPAGRPRHVAAGVLAGLAIATKYTGLFLVPGLVVGLWARTGSWRRIAQALAGAAVAFVLAAPYAVAEVQDGMFLGIAVRTYYGESVLGGAPGPGAPLRSHTALASALGFLEMNHGLGGWLMAAIGVLLLPWRLWLAPATIAVVSVITVAGAYLAYGRHVLLASVCLSLLAAGGLAELVRRVPAGRARTGVGLLVAAGVLVTPAVRASRLAWKSRGPSVVEQTLQCIERHGGPSLVASSWKPPLTPIPPERLEMRYFPSLPEAPAILRHYPIVVASSPRESAVLADDFVEVGRFGWEDDPDHALRVLALREHRRLALVDAPSPDEVRVGPGWECRGGELWDRDQETSCRGPAGPSWVESVWSRPVRLARVELILTDGRPFTLGFDLYGRDEDGGWTPLGAVPLRPLRPRLQRPPRGQALALPAAREVNGIRIERGDGPAWGIAEIRALTAR